MSMRLRDTIDRTPEYVNFIKELKEFHASKGTTLCAEPVLGGRRLDLYKIYQVVSNSGGFDEVTKNRGWKQVGDIFQFPSTCTNSAYILKGVYIRNLLGYEEEKLWKKDWKPPKELLGPNAHKITNLAGKRYKTIVKKTTPPIKSPANKPAKVTNKPPNNTVSAAAVTAALLSPLAALQQLNSNPLLIDLTNLAQPVSIPTPPPSITTASTSPQIPEEQTSIFNEKDRILFALQFGQHNDIEWALDQLVTMSFEKPEKLEINQSPFLLQLLVTIAQPCLSNHVADNALPSTARDTLDNMLKEELSDQISGPGMKLAFADLDALKVLHILRNLSFLPAYAPTLAKNNLIMELLVQGIESSMSTGHVELGRHSMDAMENIASHMVLTSEEDPCLRCVYKVVSAHDRYLVIGSVRTLTILTLNKVNHPYLKACPALPSLSQLLLSSDEELVGTALEYLYQYTRVSLDCRTRFMTLPQIGVYISLLVCVLTVKSKYFGTRFIHDDDSLPTPNPVSPQTQGENKVPRVPDLTVYHNLDEPFRCLGWVKDKFEAADRSSVLSLDDIYLLYEARFGLEKALKMRDFYTVMKIAFPKASTESSNLLGTPGQSAPVVEGLNVVGIQIKLNILQDRPQVSCQWAECQLLFDDSFSLQRHVLHDHMVPTENEVYDCQWGYCNMKSDNKNDCISHIRTHFYNQMGESCCNSPVLSPEPSSSSSSPSTPSSNISSISSVDNSDIQGIALVAAYFLNWLSKDPQAAHHFIPYEKELIKIAEQRPKLAKHIWSIRSNFKS